MSEPRLFEELLLMQACVDTYPRGDKPTGNGIGVHASSSTADNILAAAVLAELAVCGRIRVEQVIAEGRRRRIAHVLVVTDPTPLGDAETDTVLADMGIPPERTFESLALMVAKSQRPAVSPQWPKKSTLRRRLLDRLAEQGRLGVYPHRVLGIFPARTYPIVDVSAATEAKARLDALLDGAEPDARTAALALLALGPNGASPAVHYGSVPGRKIKELRQRLVDGQWGDDRLRRTINLLARTTGIPGRGRTL